jgi:hypothetical protein
VELRVGHLLPDARPQLEQHVEATVGRRRVDAARLAAVEASVAVGVPWRPVRVGDRDAVADDLELPVEVRVEPLEPLLLPVGEDDDGVDLAGALLGHAAGVAVVVAPEGGAAGADGVVEDVGGAGHDEQVALFGRVPGGVRAEERAAVEAGLGAAVDAHHVAGLGEPDGDLDERGLAAADAAVADADGATTAPTAGPRRR